MEYLLILLASIFADNFVFVRFLGIEQALASAKKPSSALTGGGMVTAVSLVAGGLTYLLYTFVFSALQISFLTLPVGVLLISAAAAGLEVAASKTERLSGVLRSHIPLITTNAVILGAVFLAMEQKMAIGAALLLFLGAGIGYTLAALVFASIRERLEHCAPPAAFAGIPIAILSAALAAMAFSGFAGLHF